MDHGGSASVGQNLSWTAVLAPKKVSVDPLPLVTTKSSRKSFFGTMRIEDTIPADGYVDFLQNAKH